MNIHDLFDLQSAQAPSFTITSDDVIVQPTIRSGEARKAQMLCLVADYKAGSTKLLKLLWERLPPALTALIRDGIGNDISVDAALDLEKSSG